MLLRATVAFVALPGVIALLVPLLLAGRATGQFRLVGLVPLAAGITLLLWCVREFYVVGRGTLAPWDPPRHLVASGLYQFTRNPMYMAVSLILIGWAIGFASVRLLVYALAMMVVFHIRVVFFEEAWLARTHREEWTRYAARVPRWVFRTRRQVVVAWIAALILAAITGLFYEAYGFGMSTAIQTAGTLPLFSPQCVVVRPSANPSPARTVTGPLPSG